MATSLFGLSERSGCKAGVAGTTLGPYKHDAPASRVPACGKTQTHSLARRACKKRNIKTRGGPDRLNAINLARPTSIIPSVWASDPEISSRAKNSPRGGHDDYGCE